MLEKCPKIGVRSYASVKQLSATDRYFKARNICFPGFFTLCPIKLCCIKQKCHAEDAHLAEKKVIVSKFVRAHKSRKRFFVLRV